MPGDLLAGSDRTLLMGVLNLTPDSFSGDGIHGRPDIAVRRAVELVEAGADILDVGGESTRPGHEPVDLEEELRRVMTALPLIHQAVNVPLSIDTRKAEVARQAVAMGATIVNDVSALSDSAMLDVVRDGHAHLVLVHSGWPGRSEIRRDPLPDVISGLSELLGRAQDAGIPQERLILDPGLGIGKGWRENVEIMRWLPELQVLEHPLLLGPSRKGMIGKALGLPPGDRVEGTVALCVVCIAGGASILRVHDVRRLRDVVRVTDALRGDPIKGEA